MQRIQAIIQGRVQGVFYRASTRDQARTLGLSGWVRNLADGTVELVAEGDESPLDQLLLWCREGPPGARVDAVDVQRAAGTGEFTGFAVRY